MARLSFEDLRFKEEKESVKVLFLKYFYFHIPHSDLESIGPFSVAEGALSFDSVSQKKAERKFQMILERGFMNLKNVLNDKPTIYVHKNSGIPLIGNNAFGLVDRGTNVIEVKPISSCNIKCIYCSVDEDQRIADFVVEADYLVSEFEKLCKFKGIKDIDAHIASQGEPTLYTPMVDLVKGISSVKGVTTISIDTNGTLLSQEKVDALVEAGLTRFNLSINAHEKDTAKEIAAAGYNIEQVRTIGKYMSTKCDVIIAPTFVPGYNDKEMVDIILYAKSIGADIGIQNFLPYKMGRNPVKPMPLDDFYSLLKKWEKETDVSLIKKASDFGIHEAPELPKPFRKGQVVDAEIVCPGRFPGEMIAIAKDRNISIPNCHKTGNVKLKISRTKHNIFIGTIV